MYDGFFGCIKLVGFVDLICKFDRVGRFDAFISDWLVGVAFSDCMMDYFGCITISGSVDLNCVFDWAEVFKGEGSKFITSDSWLIIFGVSLYCIPLSTESYVGAVIGSNYAKVLPLLNISNGLPNRWW